MSLLSVVAVPAGAPAQVGSALPGPELDYLAMGPMIAVGVTALLAIVLEAVLPRGTRRVPQVVLACAGLLAALALLILGWGDDVVTASGSLAIDGVTRFTQATLLVVGVVAVLLVADRVEDESGFAPQAAAAPGSPAEDAARRAGLEQTEVYPLLLISLLGMLVFPAANDLLTLFVALEVLSLPIYLMCGLARRRRLLSQEAAVKYFLLGAFSSAFFLYGAALLYGFAGSISLPEIGAAVTAGPVGADALLLGGVGLLVMGLLFKVSAVPFHAWTPDVYTGAPTAVTAFMAAATKVAAFGALLRVLYVAVDGARWDWQPVLWAVAIATMLLGSAVAIVQRDVKRMLAYSSIAHAGFILTGVLAMDTAGVSSTLFYLLVYAVTTLGAFAALTLVRDAGGEATALSSWAGVGRRSPVFAAVFALFLLGLAGIPLTSGFAGKFAVFSAAVTGGAGALAVVGVVASAIAVVFYLRVIVVMYFASPGEDAARVASPSLTLRAVLGLAAVATIGIGVLPTPLLTLAEQAGFFVL